MIEINIIAAILLFIAYKLSKFYIFREDNIITYVGGEGSGKTLCGGKKAEKLLSKNRFKVKWHNFLQRFKKLSNREYWARPIMYSTVPYRLSKTEWATPLPDEIPLLEMKGVDRSVYFFDEISLYISQMQIKHPNIEPLEEWFTLFRQYTKGGYLVATTQCTSKINYTIRYCLNNAYHFAGFKKYWRIYVTKCRNLSLIDDVKSVSIGNLEDDYKTVIGFLPFLRRYDTYAYSDRIKDLPLAPSKSWKRYKTNHIAKLRLKKADLSKLRTEDDE